MNDTLKKESILLFKSVPYDEVMSIKTNALTSKEELKDEIGRYRTILLRLSYLSSRKDFDTKDASHYKNYSYKIIDSKISRIVNSMSKKEKGAHNKIIGGLLEEINKPLKRSGESLRSTNNASLKDKKIIRQVAEECGNLINAEKKLGSLVGYCEQAKEIYTKMFESGESYDKISSMGEEEIREWYYEEPSNNT